MSLEAVRRAGGIVRHCPFIRVPDAAAGMSRSDPD
jgi:hypothetical protein